MAPAAGIDPAWTTFELVATCAASIVKLPAGTPAMEYTPLALVVAANTWPKRVRLEIRTTAPASGVTPSGASVRPATVPVPTNTMSTSRCCPGRLMCVCTSAVSPVSTLAATSRMVSFGRPNMRT